MPTSNTPAATATRQTNKTTQNARPTLFRLAHRVIRAYREQLAKDNQALLIAQFGALDRSVGQLQSSITDRADPLEQLWRLRPHRPWRAEAPPAKRPTAASRQQSLPARASDLSRCYEAFAGYDVVARLEPGSQAVASNDSVGVKIGLGMRLQDTHRHSSTLSGSRTRGSPKSTSTPRHPLGGVRRHSKERTSRSQWTCSAS